MALSWLLSARWWSGVVVRVWRVWGVMVWGMKKPPCWRLEGELLRVIEGVLFEPDDLHAEPVVYLPEPVLQG